MALLGPNSIKVITERVVTPTPVVRQVIAYAYRDSSKQLWLNIHVVTDDGVKNTVMPKLFARADDELAKSYEHECATGLEKYRWFHTGPIERFPIKHQVIYSRPEVA